MREHLWHGRDFSGKLAAIRRVGDGQGALSRRRAPRQLGLLDCRTSSGPAPSISLNITTPVDDQLDWLLREEPDYLLTHPTMLDRLVRRSVELGRRPKRLKQVLTISEILAPGLRGALPRRVGRAASSTPTARARPAISPCSARTPTTIICSRRRRWSRSSIPTANPARLARSGGVIVTPLHNLAMPLGALRRRRSCRGEAALLLRPRPAGDPAHPWPAAELCCARPGASAGRCCRRTTSTSLLAPGADPAIPVRPDPP